MTTQEYLQWLREGDYTRILHWRDALLEHYSPKKSYLEADILIPLMTYELINHEFKIEDFHHVEIINALLKSTLKIPGDLDYCWTLFVSAALQFHVYDDNSLLPFYKTTQSMDLSAVSEWMARDNGVLTDAQNDAALAEKQDLLLKNQPDCQRDVEQVEEKILAVVFYQNNCKDYVNFLKSCNNSGDVNSSIRLGLANALYEYLLTEVIETPRLSDKLSGFLNKIKEINPSEWEERYLIQFTTKSYLPPQTVLQKLYEKSAQTLLFFAAGAINSLVPPISENTPSKEPENTTIILDRE
jgi:hypothetical protein